MGSIDPAGTRRLRHIGQRVLVASGYLLNLGAGLPSKAPPNKLPRAQPVFQRQESQPFEVIQLAIVSAFSDTRSLKTEKRGVIDKNRTQWRAVIPEAEVYKLRPHRFALGAALLVLIAAGSF